MVRVAGHYELLGELGSGGMATVYLGRLTDASGRRRDVAIKRMHPHLAKDPAQCAAFWDEARVAARIRHPNVVPTLDVLSDRGELFIVMEYVDGKRLCDLTRGEATPPAVAAAIVCDLLEGLHAAHEAVDDTGQPLGVIHRDVSPQNVLVGVDGSTRVLDFGIAKARGRLRSTQDSTIKGKLAYMSPDQLWSGDLDRRADVYAAGVVLWETLTGGPLFAGNNEAVVVHRIVYEDVAPPSLLVPAASVLDEVVLRAVSRDREKRPPTARDMAREIAAAVTPASRADIASWVAQRRTRQPRKIDASSDTVAMLRSVESVLDDLAETRAHERGKPSSAATAVIAPAVVEPAGSLRALTTVAPPGQPPASPRRRFGAALATALLALTALVGVGAIVIGTRARTTRTIASSPASSETIESAAADPAPATALAAVPSEPSELPAAPSIGAPAVSVEPKRERAARATRPRATTIAPAAPLAGPSESRTGAGMQPARAAPKDPYDHL